MTGLERIREWRRPVWEFNLFNRQQWVAEQARRIPPGARVLDAGAGPGQYRQLFAHCDYKAQDFAREPGTAGKYTPLDYESDITAIPVPDASFDAVICTEVLEHVPDPVAALAEMARILKPGGRLLLTAPLASYLHQEPYHYYGGYTPYWYRKFLPERGRDLRTSAQFSEPHSLHLDLTLHALLEELSVTGLAACTDQRVGAAPLAHAEHYDVYTVRRDC